MPYYIAEQSFENGKLQIQYFTEDSTSEKAEDAKIFLNREDANKEVIKRDSDASVIFFQT